MEAYVHGVSTRKVDDLVSALGIDAGISKSEVSRICGELDGVVATFRDQGGRGGQHRRRQPRRITRSDFLTSTTIHLGIDPSFRRPIVLTPRRT